jgi:hypothetical protein
MKFMILAYETPDDFDTRRNPARLDAYMAPWYAFGKALQPIGGSALESPETATRVSVRGGRRIIKDGPFADAKEQLGGYFIIEAESLAEATERAKACPAAKTGRVEVRAVPNYQGA